MGKMFYHSDIRSVALLQLKNILENVAQWQNKKEIVLDAYSKAHLLELERVLEQALYKDRK